jgi:hypothetical protein
VTAVAATVCVVNVMRSIYVTHSAACNTHVPPCHYWVKTLIAANPCHEPTQILCHIEMLTKLKLFHYYYYNGSCVTELEKGIPIYMERERER